MDTLASELEHVTIEVSDSIAVVTLNRPPMNALSTQVQAELGALARAINDRRDIRVVVLHGGPKVFAAGADVKEMAEWDHLTMVDRSRGISAAFSAVAGIGQPVIAAITGYALGGGLELALCADIRIAGDNVKVGLPEILLGIIPGAGGTQRLPRLIGPARAKELIFTGRMVGAEEALSLGIVDQIVAPDDVLDAAMNLARRLAVGPPYALRAAKVAIDRGLEVDLLTGLEIERMQFSDLFATHDQERGMRSFIENGPGKATFEGN